MNLRKWRSVLSICLVFLLLAASCGTGDELTNETRPSTQEETQAATGAVTEPETETEPETVPETDPATETEALAESETETETEVQPPLYLELDFCHYNYECVKSVNEVEADGVYHEEEWAEAVELVINNETLQDWGRWQEGNPMDITNLNVSYRLKWDENYLYLLEIRMDSRYIHDFGSKSYDVFSEVWGGDGTAFFFCDGIDSLREDRCDIGFFSYVDQLEGPAVYVGSFDGEPNAFRGPSGTDGCTYGGSYDDETTTAVFEMKLPWSIMEEQGKLYSDIEAGTLFRFNPIIPSVDTQEGLGQYNEEWRQINFHDCIENGEGGNPDDPYYWAALTLVITPSEE